MIIFLNFSRGKLLNKLITKIRFGSVIVYLYEFYWSVNCILFIIQMFTRHTYTSSHHKFWYSCILKTVYVLVEISLIWREIDHELTADFLDTNFYIFSLSMSIQLTYRRIDVSLATPTDHKIWSHAVSKLIMLFRSFPSTRAILYPESTPRPSYGMMSWCRYYCGTLWCSASKWHC